MQSRQVYVRVAELHLKNIEQGFLSSLGLPFLSLLYEAIDTSSSGVLVLAREDDRIVGFVAGSTSGMRPLLLELLSRPARLAAALLPKLTSVRNMARMLEVILGHGGRQSGLPRAELLSIAVDRAYRRRGHAEALYKTLEEHFVRKGHPQFRIIVGEALASAHRFYERAGAKPVTTVEMHRGERSTVYVQERH